MSQTTDSKARTKKYLLVWLVLLIAMVVSLALEPLMKATHPELMVAVIFVIAIFKAYLVITEFMHFHHEPTYMQISMASAFAVLIIAFGGLYPDVVAVDDVATDILEHAPGGANEELLKSQREALLK